MKLFTEVPGSAAILVKQGGYYQVPLYRRNGSDRVYAKLGGAIVLISGGNTTSKANVRWEYLECEELSNEKLHPVTGPSWAKVE